MDWPLVKLYQITERFISGGTPSTKASEYWSGDIPWITGADINDRVVLEGRKQITQEAVENSATNIVPKRAILLVTRTGVGKIAKAGVDIAISQDLTGIVLKEKIDPDFVIAAISYKINSLVSLQQGSTIKGILRSDVENMEIPLPPLSEQRRIVEILDQADALRKKRAEADAKAERLLPALFYKMFGDPATNPKGWPVVDGNTIFSQVRYGVGSPPPFSEEGVPFLRAGNIKRGQVIHRDLVFFEPIHAKSISRSKVNEGDIVIVRRGAYTGECAEIPSEFDAAYVGYDLICVPSSTTNPKWFSAAFNSPSIWQQIESIRKRAAQQGLNKDQILSFKLPYPPKDLQDEFAEKAISITTQYKNMVIVKDKLELLFQALLHRAFSGDLTTKWREAHTK